MIHIYRNMIKAVTMPEICVHWKQRRLKLLCVLLSCICFLIWLQHSRFTSDVVFKTQSMSPVLLYVLKWTFCHQIINYRSIPLTNKPVYKILPLVSHFTLLEPSDNNRRHYQDTYGSVLVSFVCCFSIAYPSL